jgi:hypothetical protein
VQWERKEGGMVRYLENGPEVTQPPPWSGGMISQGAGAPVMGTPVWLKNAPLPPMPEFSQMPKYVPRHSYVLVSLPSKRGELIGSLVQLSV